MHSSSGRRVTNPHITATCNQSVKGAPSGQGFKAKVDHSAKLNSKSEIPQWLSLKASICHVRGTKSKLNSTSRPINRLPPSSTHTYINKTNREIAKVYVDKVTPSSSGPYNQISNIIGRGGGKEGLFPPRHPTKI